MLGFEEWVGFGQVEMGKKKHLLMRNSKCKCKEVGT